MTKADKQAYVQEMSTLIREAKAAVFTQYRGTSVAQMENVRRKLHEQGITYKVTKNSLLKRVLDEAGITVSDAAVLDLPLAMASSNTDEVLAAKAIAALGKEIETIVPVAGIVNQEFVYASTIQRLAKLPGREEMYAKIAGGLASLPTRMVRSIANPMQGLVTALSQIQTQKEG